MFFLKRGCKACSAYSTAREWYDQVKKVKEVLEKYSDVLPEPELSRVNSTLEMVDLTDSGVAKVCKVLKYDLKKLAKKLPILGGASSLLLKGVITIAIIAGGATVLWRANKVKLTIMNDGCTPVPIASKLPEGFGNFIDKLGIKLPLWIGTNGRETFSLPPVKLSVFSTGSSMKIETLGQSLDFTLPLGVTSITFNGREILGSQTDLNFREQKNHTVVVRCE